MTIKRPTGIAPAAEFRDDRINPLLKSAGVRTIAEFHKRLEEGLRQIPEVRTLSQVADKHGCVGVLSGGTASMVIGELVQSWASGAGMRPLNDLASDVDALIMPKSNVYTPQLVSTVMDDLNRSNRDLINDSVPSSLRRKMVLEWDINPADGFYEATVQHGGDTASQIGVGLHGDKLCLFDPHGGMDDFFRGVLRYEPTDKPETDSALYKNVQYDPSLEGLRLIRMIGRFKEWGLEASPETRERLDKMGQDALERKTLSRALIGGQDPSGDFKLQRRWEKYVDRIWADASDISDAMSLLDSTQYTQVLQHLGLGNKLLSPLAERGIDKAKAEKAGSDASEGVRANNPMISGDSVPDQYIWLSSKMLGQFTKGKVYGRAGGEFGAGLQTVGSTLDGKGFGAILVKVDLNPSAHFLDMRSSFGRELEAKTAKKLGLETKSVSDRIGAVVAELGAAGVLYGGSPPDLTIGARAGIKGFTEEPFSGSHVVQELTNPTPQNREGTMLRMRALIALEREAGLARIANAIDSKQLPLNRILYSDVVDLLLQSPVRSKKLAKALHDAGEREGEGLGVTLQVELYRLLAGLQGTPVDQPLANRAVTGEESRT